jgi:hypothetical protein
MGFFSYDDIVRTSAKLAFKDGSIQEIIDEDFVLFGKYIRDLNEE